jgi:hypothetical protein
MLYITVARALLGFALLGTLGVVVALATQGFGMWLLDNRLEARDHRQFEKDGGWPNVDDFPVMGQKDLTK